MNSLSWGARVSLTSHLLLQILNQMLARGASVGLLTDGRVYVFLMLRSRLSGCGEEGGQPTDWHLHYYVARYCDCLTGEDENKVPSVLQCFAYALQCAKRHQRSGPEATNWLKRLADVVRSGQSRLGAKSLAICVAVR